MSIGEDFHSQVGDGKLRTTLYKVCWDFLREVSVFYLRFNFVSISLREVSVFYTHLSWWCFVIVTCLISYNYEASHRWSDEVGGSSRAGLVAHSTGGTGL